METAFLGYDVHLGGLYALVKRRLINFENPLNW